MYAATLGTVGGAICTVPQDKTFTTVCSDSAMGILLY